MHPTAHTEATHHDDFYTADADVIFASHCTRIARERSLRALRRILSETPRPTVLSLGSGDGRLEHALAPYCGRIVGIEVSAVAVRAAREGAPPNAQFIVGDAVKAAEIVGGTRFDVVFALGTLHHLSDSGIAALLASVPSMLRPGGAWFSADPSSRRLVGAFKRFVRGKVERYHSPDEREIDPRHVAALLEHAGLYVEYVRPADFFLGPLGWIMPRIPSSVAVGLAAIDRAVTLAPWLSQRASNVMIRANMAPALAAPA